METTIKFKVEGMNEALKKVGVSLKKGYLCKVDLKHPMKEEKYYMIITTNDGIVQTSAPVFVTFVGEIPEKCEFVVGCEFANVVYTMGALGEEIKAVINDSTVIVSCGNAETRLSRMAETDTEGRASVEEFVFRPDPEMVIMNAEAEELKNAILNTSYCAAEDDLIGLRNLLQLNVHMNEKTDNENGFGSIKCVVSDGHCAATADAKLARAYRVAEHMDEDGKKGMKEVALTAGEDFFFVLPCDKARQVATQLNKDVVIMVSKEFVIIRCINDVYMLRRLVTGYPETFLEKLETLGEQTIKVSSKEVSIALKLLEYASSKENVVVFETKKKKFVISDDGKHSVTEVKIEEGKDFPLFGLQLPFIKRAVEKAGVGGELILRSAVDDNLLVLNGTKGGTHYVCRCSIGNKA